MSRGAVPAERQICKRSMQELSFYKPSLPCTYLYMNGCNKNRSPHACMRCSGSRCNMHDFAPKCARMHLKCCPPPPPQERRPAMHTATALCPLPTCLLLLHCRRGRSPASAAYIHTRPAARDHLHPPFPPLSNCPPADLYMPRADRSAQQGTGGPAAAGDAA